MEKKVSDDVKDAHDGEEEEKREYDICTLSSLSHYTFPHIPHNHGPNGPVDCVQNITILSYHHEHAVLQPRLENRKIGWEEDVGRERNAMSPV